MPLLSTLFLEWYLVYYCIYITLKIVYIIYECLKTNYKTMLTYLEYQPNLVKRENKLVFYGFIML